MVHVAQFIVPTYVIRFHRRRRLAQPMLFCRSDVRRVAVGEEAKDSTEKSQGGESALRPSCAEDALALVTVGLASGMAKVEWRALHLGGLMGVYSPPGVISSPLT